MQLDLFGVGGVLYHPNRPLNLLCPPRSIGLTAQLNKILVVFTVLFLLLLLILFLQLLLLFLHKIQKLL